MKKDMKQVEEVSMPFSEAIKMRDAAEGITDRDYRDSLELNVKVPLQTAYRELLEIIVELPKASMWEADSFLSIQRAAFMLWEQIDKAYEERHQTHPAK